jgi:phosphate transport system substrate-binding protein
MEMSQRTTKSDIVIIVTICLLIAMLGATVRAAEKKMITIKGSDTMVHLVSNWAEEFMKSYPDTEIGVTGGGSGTGIAALINGTTEICAASREIKEKEKEQARSKGHTPKEVIVARDGIAIVVNPKNTVSELDMQQLSQIFTGVLTNWNQVGGGKEKMLVFSRESSSGTYTFFQEHVLKNKDYTPKAKLMTATSAIIESVSTDKGAIGYVGLGYALAAKDKVKIISVKADANSPAIVPSEQAVKSGQYPIARPLYLYVAEKTGGEVGDFVNFCLSDKGQAIVKDAGYVTVQ